MPAEPSREVEADVKATDSRIHGEGWAVILHNDEDHIRDEVVLQVMIALRCGIGMADGIVARVEYAGKAIISITSLREARRMLRILEAIALHTELQHIS
ncbi:ATP-dependent Clp protease adaptor ClpS [Candidatus Sumerlaeota bacterium]